MDYAVWMEKAIKSIATISERQTFVVKDLFQGAEWKSLGRGDKLSFGKYFKNAITDKRVPNVEYVGKADNNSALYIKKGRTKDETDYL